MWISRATSLPIKSVSPGAAVTYHWSAPAAGPAASLPPRTRRAPTARQPTSARRHALAADWCAGPVPSAHRRRGHRDGGGARPGQPGPAAALGGGDFLAEAGPELLVVTELGPDHLERYPPPTRRARQVDPPHASCAEPGAQLVASNFTRIVAGQRLNQANP
ncbi:MAG TPA: hypothetical protein VMV92_23430 [Streptosporangiaceae bacterium]|nr:hypothetical protein [Streptosporangiaceae bacterium]